jgi:multicomponent Na+:H+ antiporter subunit C
VSVLGHVNYWFVILLMMVGFYILISRGNLVKKLLGLSLFQTSVFIMYISLGKIRGGTAPILLDYGHGGHGDEGGHGGGGDHGTSNGHAAADGAEHAAEGATAAGDYGADGLASAGSDAPDHTAGPVADASDALADTAVQAAGYATDATGEVLYSNPLPHVLILTAIVVGIATTALGLSLVIRIRESYGTIEEDEIHAMDTSL